MPKSKVDKSRKEKLIKYKKSKKMSTQAPEMKPFRQVPSWSTEDTFTLSGAELESLYNFFNIFAPVFTSVQTIFARGVQDGKIKIGYEYADGTPVADAEISAYTEKLNEYFKEKQAQKEQESGGKVLNMHGVEANEENIG